MATLEYVAQIDNVGHKEYVGQIDNVGHREYVGQIDNVGHREYVGQIDYVNKTLRVYSVWTRQRHFDRIKHDALVSEHVSQSEHSHRTRHGAATKLRQGNEPIRSSSHVSNVNNHNRMMSAVNGMSAMRAQCVDAISVNALLKPAKL